MDIYITSSYLKIKSMKKVKLQFILVFLQWVKCDFINVIYRLFSIWGVDVNDTLMDDWIGSMLVENPRLSDHEEEKRTISP